VAEISNSLSGRVALVTGAAHRIGAQTTRTLHHAGMDLVLHYRSSESKARALAQELEQERPDSVLLLQADLGDTAGLPALIENIRSWRGRLDVLVNNASGFYATPVGETSEEQWNDLMGSNLKAPYFLAQAAAPLLREHQGTIVNMVDIHAERPLKDYPVYSMAKAANAMMVKALARELGPEIRVNGIAPGSILWPEGELADEVKQEILDRTALKRLGDPEDIARTILFLIREADYITGQIIAVDGGRTAQH
jgi:pteridine reductase